jgi:hypothetical protein
MRHTLAHLPNISVSREINGICKIGFLVLVIDQNGIQFTCRKAGDADVEINAGSATALD